jgi:NADPH:quinone reductase-like Zn-dependent oxidoreductase
VKRIVVERYGGPDVLRLVEDEEPRPARGEVCVRVLAAGVSFTDALLRAGTYFGVPKPPFTPGYELVGVVEEVGAGCSRLRVGDRIGSLTVWGAYAERVCVPEEGAVAAPEDVDPAELVSLLFPYMTAYQVLHRTAQVRAGESVLVHGAAGRVGSAALELGKQAGLRLFGTASARDRPALERLGAVAIDYRGEDFRRRLRALPERGVDVVLDGLGGPLSLRSFGALRPGGRLVVFGHYATLAKGRKSSRGWAEWYAATALLWLWSLFSPRRRVLAYRIQKLRDRAECRLGAAGGAPRDPNGFRDDFTVLSSMLRARAIHPVVAERLPLSEARRAHELLERTAATGRLVLVP